MFNVIFERLVQCGDSAFSFKAITWYSYISLEREILIVVRCSFVLFFVVVVDVVVEIVKWHMAQESVCRFYSTHILYDINSIITHTHTQTHNVLVMMMMIMMKASELATAHTKPQLSSDSFSLLWWFFSFDCLLFVDFGDKWQGGSQWLFGINWSVIRNEYTQSNWRWNLKVKLQDCWNYFDFSPFIRRAHKIDDFFQRKWRLSCSN